MSTIVTIQASDLITNSRADLNTNFSNLNTDKFETSNIDTDSTFAANSDTKVPSQKAVKTAITALGSLQIVPTGSVLAFGSATPPTGWLLCDGSPVSRSTYATLFGITGTSFGVGNGSTTFNVPDLRSRFIMGAGTAGTKVFTFVSRSSDTITASTIANSTSNENQTGQAVLYTTTGSEITGLTTNTTYYLIRITYNTFKLATTLANAQNGTAISLSGDGSGTRLFTFTLATRALADTGGEESHAMSSTELLSHTHAADTFSGSGSGSVGSSGVNHGTDGVPTAGGNAAMNITSPFVAITYIIRT